MSDQPAWLQVRALFAGGIPPAIRRSLRKAVQFTRRGPNGLARIGLCYFEIVPETEELILSDYYEHEERAAIRKFLDPRSPVIEVGGSQGIISCITNRLLKNKAQHVVVEANSGVLPLLKRNRDRNRCKFEVIHAAVGPDGTSLRFFQNENPLQSSAFVVSDEYYDVPCVSLARLVNDRGFDHCTLVCDIEGAEIALIQSEGDILRDRFHTLIIEFHPMITGPGEVTRALEALKHRGFSVASIERHVYVLQKRE